jgi:hypothetical protein
VILAGAYASVWRQSPICLREARVNSVTRIAFEKALTQELKKLPAGSSLLMFTGSHVGALEAANFHLARTINENNYRLWQAALLHPAHSSDYVLAIAGDPVSRAVQADSVGLTPITTIQTKGAPVATLYRSESSGKP